MKNKEELKSLFKGDQLYLGGYVKNKIDQLDEPETLSPEWIESEKWQAYDPDGRTLYWVVSESDLEEVLVPNQGELETKILELIERYKKEIEDVYSNPENFRIVGFIEDLKSLVKKEQRYYVIDKDDNILLLRGYDGVEKADNLKIHNSGGGALKLTEQEIKDYDPRFWPFRQPVEELEE